MDTGNSLIQFFTIILVMAWTMFHFIRVVPPDELLVIFTFGKFEGVRGPGILFVIPIYQQCRRISLKPKSIEVAVKNTPDSNGALVSLTATISYRITNPEQTYANGINSIANIDDISQIVIKERVTNYKYGLLLRDKAKVSEELRSALAGC